MSKARRSQQGPQSEQGQQVAGSENQSAGMSNQASLDQMGVESTGVGTVLDLKAATGRDFFTEQTSLLAQMGAHGQAATAAGSAATEEEAMAIERRFVGATYWVDEFSFVMDDAAMALTQDESGQWVLDEASRVALEKVAERAAAADEALVAQTTRVEALNRIALETLGLDGRMESLTAQFDLIEAQFLKNNSRQNRLISEIEDVFKNAGDIIEETLVGQFLAIVGGFAVDLKNEFDAVTGVALAAQGMYSAFGQIGEQGLTGETMAGFSNSLTGVVTATSDVIESSSKCVAWLGVVAQAGGGIIEIMKMEKERRTMRRLVDEALVLAPSQDANMNTLHATMMEIEELEVGSCELDGRFVANEQMLSTATNHLAELDAKFGGDVSAPT